MYGFPFELTREIAEENGLKVDEAGYKVAMQEQKERAKAATAKISVIIFSIFSTLFGSCLKRRSTSIVARLSKLVNV